MSLPCAPALPTIAPPTVPGMPAAHSRPASPCRAAWRATRPRLAPDSTHTTGGCSWGEKRTWRARLISTRPGTPLSFTSTLEPPPSTTKGKLYRQHKLTAAANSCADCTSSSASAGPPMREAVKRARGTPFCRRSPKIGSSAACALAKSAVSESGLVMVSSRLRLIVTLP